MNRNLGISTLEYLLRQTNEKANILSTCWTLKNNDNYFIFKICLQDNLCAFGITCIRMKMFLYLNNSLCFYFYKIIIIIKHDAKDHIIFCSGVEKEATGLPGVFSCMTPGNGLYYLGVEQILCVRADISCKLHLNAG